MQLGDQFWGSLGQSFLQDVREELMIAVPFPFVIQRNDKEILLPERLQHSIVIIPGVQDGFAKRPGQAVQDGGLQEKAAHLFRLLLEDFLEQVIHHIMMASGERGDEGIYILAPLHRDGSQLQAGDPALGPRFQGSHLRLSQAQAHHLLEELPAFPGREAQPFGPDLGELAAGAQPGQGQGRINPGQNGYVEMKRQMVQQESDRLMDCRQLDQVIVVQDKDRVPWKIAQAVDQERQNPFGVRQLGRIDERFDLGRQAILQAVEGSGKIAEETDQVIVIRGE